MIEICWEFCKRILIHPRTSAWCLAAKRVRGSRRPFLKRQLFPNNDLPRVSFDRIVRRLLHLHGICPVDCVVLGGGAVAEEIAHQHGARPEV